MRLYLLPLLLLTFLLFNSCKDDDTEEVLDGTSFSIFLENADGTCNDTNLSFQFSLDHTSRGIQESYTVSSGDTIDATNMTFLDRDILNIKVFEPSTETPLHMLDFQMVFRDYNEAQLTSPNNEIRIKYCSSLEIGNISITVFSPEG